MGGKKDKIAKLKEGQKEGEKKLDMIQKKLQERNDFLFMFNKYPGNFFTHVLC